MYKFIYQVI